METTLNSNQRCLNIIDMFRTGISFNVRAQSVFGARHKLERLRQIDPKLQGQAT